MNLHKFFDHNLNCIVGGEINVDYLTESSKKKLKLTEL